MNDKFTSDDIFNEMIINIGSSIFDIHVKLTRFVCEVMAEMNAEELEVELTFPYLNMDQYLTLQSEKIIYNSEDEKIYITARDLEDTIEWITLDISVQDIIVNEIHRQYRAEKIYQELSSKNEFN